MAKNNAINANNIDSPINCIDNCQRNAPTDFLTPTSLALSAERAVERFIKLTQAISNTTRAIIKKIFV